MLCKCHICSTENDPDSQRTCWNCGVRIRTQGTLCFINSSEILLVNQLMHLGADKEYVDINGPTVIELGSMQEMGIISVVSERGQHKAKFTVAGIYVLKSKELI